ncbi:hypothetical protein Rt10032_c19g6188 [Rhodotorula toruloides]|uniref:Uncharacterized protein n=1 Tax=Rhodotorula toruloides TaxID=5286 RepID=A0A511KPA9_RHOTO|nr:hypothetical protein Rt10032_c19g6188 [Rhodotorula toruloides]
MFSAHSPVTPATVETTISAAAELARTAGASMEKEPKTVLARLSRFFSTSRNDSVTAGPAAAPESAATAALSLVSTVSSTNPDERSSNNAGASWVATYSEFGMKAWTAMTECPADCLCNDSPSSPASSLSSATSSRTFDYDSDSDSDSASFASYKTTSSSTSTRSSRSKRSSSLPSAASSRIFDSDSDSLTSASGSHTSYETTPTSSGSSRPSPSTLAQRQARKELVSYGSPYAEHFDLVTIAAQKDHERRCREGKHRKPRGNNDYGQELYPRMSLSEMYALKYDLRRKQLQPHIDDFEQRKGRRMRASEAFELKYKLLTPDVAQQPKKLSKRIAQIREAYARENQLHEQIGGRRLRASEVPAFYCPQPLPEYAHYGMLAEDVDFDF